MADNLFLYWGSGSVPCWKPMIVLEEKGLSGYPNKLLSFEKKEHKGEEVLKINPRGQLPTFKDGDVIINESGAICDYLESMYKGQGTKLIPDDPKARAKVLQRVWECENLRQKLIIDILFYFFLTKEEDRKEEVLQSKCQAAKEELKLWEGYLGESGPFLCGKDFTMADVAFFPFTAYLYRLGFESKEFPNINNYYTKLKDRPSIKASWPPHWNEGASKAFPFKGI